MFVCAANARNQIQEDDDVTSMEPAGATAAVAPESVVTPAAGVQLSLDL